MACHLSLDGRVTVCGRSLSEVFSTDDTAVEWVQRYADYARQNGRLGQHLTHLDSLVQGCRQCVMACKEQQAREILR